MDFAIRIQYQHKGEEMQVTFNDVHITEGPAPRKSSSQVKLKYERLIQRCLDISVPAITATVSGILLRKFWSWLALNEIRPGSAIYYVTVPKQNQNELKELIRSGQMMGKLNEGFLNSRKYVGELVSLPDLMKKVEDTLRSVKATSVQLLTKENKELAKPAVSGSKDDKKEISKQEQALSEKLRSLCYVNGQERKENLPQTAELLFTLGKVYLEEIEGKRGLDQKLHAIRCSALLNGAKLRFERVKNRSKVKEVDAVSLTFNETILRVSRAKRSSNLLQFSQKVFSKLRKFRERIENDCKGLKNIEHSLLTEDEFLLSEEKDKIKKVEQLSELIADETQALLREISVECSRILGPSPCKFCQVGLGSLARKETTPFSDFEHVIVLEEGVQHRKSYEEILEYFRWYTVINQLIFINFGETFIKSVAIKSLDWFYDAVTPVGFAYDGMAPQASSNPLGRMPTKNRPLRVELIKSVSEMANYLSRREQMKNGYYLHEILKNTCFVYGDETLHDQYKALVLKKVRKPDAFEVNQQYGLLIRNILPDVVSFNRSILFVDPTRNDFNIKSQIYRPVVTRLASLARVNGIANDSSFEIVNELEERQLVDRETAHDLRVTVAVANEIRQKVYIFAKNQRHKISTSDLMSFVGKHSLMRLFYGMNELHKIFSKDDDPYFENEKQSLLLENKLLTKAYICYYIIPCYDDALGVLKPEVQRLFHVRSQLDTEDSLYFGEVLALYLVVLRTVQAGQEHLDEIARNIPRVLKHVPKRAERKIYLPYHYHLTKIALLTYSDNQKAFVESEEFRKELESRVVTEEIDEMILVNWDHICSKILEKVNEHQLIVERSQKCLEFWKSPKQCGNKYRDWQIFYFEKAISSAQALLLTKKKSMMPVDRSGASQGSENDAFRLEMSPLLRCSKGLNIFAKAEQALRNVTLLMEKNTPQALDDLESIWQGLGQLRENTSAVELEVFDEVAAGLAVCHGLLNKFPNVENKDKHKRYGADFVEQYLKSRSKCGFKDEAVSLLGHLYEIYLVKYKVDPTEKYLRKKILRTQERIATSLRSKKSLTTSNLFLPFTSLPLREAVKFYDGASETLRKASSVDVPLALLRRFQICLDFLKDRDEGYECLKFIFQHYRNFVCEPRQYLRFMIYVSSDITSAKHMELGEKTQNAFRNEYKLPNYLPQEILNLYNKALLKYNLANFKTSSEALCTLLVTCKREDVRKRCLSLLCGMLMYILKIELTKPAHLYG